MNPLPDIQPIHLHLLGSALVTFGKVTKNAALIEKGNARKAGPAPAPTTTTTAAAPAPSTA